MVDVCHLSAPEIHISIENIYIYVKYSFMVQLRNVLRTKNGFQIKSLSDMDVVKERRSQAPLMPIIQERNSVVLRIKFFILKCLFGNDASINEIHAFAGAGRSCTAWTSKFPAEGASRVWEANERRPN